MEAAVRPRSVLALATFCFSLVACADDLTTAPGDLDQALDGTLPGLAQDGSSSSTGLKTVAYALSRSGSAGAAAGSCGTRLQCFKTAIIETNASTAAGVEKVALALLDQAAAEQDVNLKLSGKQLLIGPTADPNLNGKPDFVDALNKVSLGGATCFTCALQAAKSSFAGAGAGSFKVIVLVSERPNGFLPADQTQLSQMEFDANTVIHAFAVGPAITCQSNPAGYGSLSDAAALTPGGSCTTIASFEGLSVLLTDAVNRSGGPPPPDETAPVVTLTTPANASSTTTLPTFAGSAGTAGGDLATVTVRIWRGSDAVVQPLQTLVTTRTGATYSVRASPALTEGSYIAQAEQRDAAGNIGLTGFVSFVVVPPPPPPDGTTGKTVAWALSRSGSAGSPAGACGSRLQCFKTAFAEANASTSSLVEAAALVLINVAEPEQDVNMLLAGKQLLVPPGADPNGNGRPDFLDALDRVSLGGGTCFVCALQAAELSFAGAQPGSPKVIVLVSERVNVHRSTGFTSAGLPTGYPPLDLSQMTFSDPNTVIHAFAVGPNVRCDSDPNGYGSLNAAAALTPGGTCTNVDSFEGLGAVIATAVTGPAQVAGSF
jgi:hypothetical protein